MGKNFLRVLIALGLMAGCSGGDDGRNVTPFGGGTQPASGGNGSGGVGGFTGGAVSGGFQPPIGGSVVLPPTSTKFEEDATGSSGLSPDVINQLKAGGASCTAPIIYPYADTTFPGGLISPPFMWEGGAEAAYIKVSYELLDTVMYEFAVGPSDPGELRIPAEAWAEITRRTQNSVLNVTLNVLRGGAVSSCPLRLNIAQGNMVGSIYYNTYNAPGVMTPGNGAVMRLNLGQPQSEIYLQYTGGIAAPVTGPCIACHSVSFNGSTIVASTHSYVPFSQVFDVFKYDISQATQPAQGASIPNANFGALTPRGDKILAFGNPECTNGSDTFPRTPNNFPLVEGPEHARLLNTADGSEIAATGLSPDVYMWMPQFSPNGDKVVFNYARPDGAGTNRRDLAVMDFDDATNTFSNLRVIASNLGPAPSLLYEPTGAGAGPINDPANMCTGPAASNPLLGQVGRLDPGRCTGPCYPAYPFFTPDGNAVVFAMISEPDFSSAFPGRSKPAMGELWYVDLKAGSTPIPLDNINRTLKAEEAQHEYYPTVLPVAIGGRFWVVWTSRRSFGHRVIGDSVAISPEEDPFRKRLWAAAIKPRDPTKEIPDVGDPSTPGFYLEGQSDSGNVRGFATLSPCKPSGSGPEAECTSGLDCCTGFCEIAENAAVGFCTEEKPECSKTNEKCEVDTDCCKPLLDQPTNTCVAGFCSFL